MHGIDHSITFTRILALDLGKFNSVACIYERATHEHRFVSVQTTPQRMVMFQESKFLLTVLEMYCTSRIRTDT